MSERDMDKSKKIESMLHNDGAGLNGARRLRLMPHVLMAMAAIGITGGAVAMDLSPSDSDLSINWDNTIRYSLGQRVEKQNQIFINTPHFDESDLKFKRGDIVTNRVDVLSEFDLIYKRNMGLRVSAAGWYDAAYNSQVNSNPALTAAGYVSSYTNNQFSSYTQRYYAGPSGEILDAFVFDKFNVGQVPVNVKVGRQVNYWGESIFAPYTGVNYGQAPVDLIKATSNPGSSVKELFLPSNQISAQAQLTDTLSVAAYYGLEWRPDRIPDGGTYLGDLGFLFAGPNRLPIGFGLAIPKVNPLTPDKRGDWGVNTRWNPQWLDGTVGFYYRKFNEKLPWVQVDPVAFDYREVFAKDTSLYGVSLSKVVGGVSVGAELAYRQNAALLSSNVSTVDNQGARGDTISGLINGIWYFGRSPLWDSASFVGELTWTHLNSVNVHRELVNAVGYASCVGKGKWDGCTTKNAVGATVAFTPTWNQALPSLDLSMPMSIGMGIKGNGATPGSTNQGAGSYSIGLSALYKSKYQIDLKFIDYLVRYKDNGTSMTSFNGQNPAVLSDRGWVSLTFKTTF